MKALRPETLSVLDEVERLSGKGVEFLADPELTVLTSVQTARNGAPHHLVRYQPGGEPLDYFLVYQAGFLIRLFRCPASLRCDFVPLSEAGLKMEHLIRTALHGHSTIQTVQAKVAEMVAQWALLTLRSLPVGMRVDSWIADEHPTLSRLQQAGIALQQQQNADALGKSLSEIPVPSALLGMYAANAMFVDRMMGRRRYAIPYEAAGLSAVGDALLELFDRTPTGPSSDRTLIDGWAEILGLNGWYEWQLYRP